MSWSRPSGSTGGIYSSLGSNPSGPEPAIMPSNPGSYPTSSAYPTSQPSGGGYAPSAPFLQPRAIHVPSYTGSSYPDSRPSDDDCCRSMCKIL